MPLASMSAMRWLPKSWMRATSCVARGAAPRKKPHRLRKPGSQEAGFSSSSFL